MTISHDARVLALRDLALALVSTGHLLPEHDDDAPSAFLPEMWSPVALGADVLGARD